MSDGPGSNLKFVIGHVLFIDIVGYSKLLITEQSELLRKLTEHVRETEPFRTGMAEEHLIRLPTGDGMALVFRNSPEAPVQCALELSKRLRAHPDLPLRMGIHSGPVNEVIDVTERANVTGAGINIAQRVMDCGDAGHILLSKHVADDLEQYPQWRPHLHELGQCEVKHGVRVHLSNFYGDGFGNSAIPARFAHTRNRATPHGITARLLIAALLLLVAAAGYLVLRSIAGTHVPVASTAAAPDKSIAVLPFENLSDEKGNAFFVEGIQDELLTRLAKIADLKVISRTSTLRFKSRPENLRDIARQLGVARILEGSAQRAKNRVRVNVQLIDAVTDTHLWAETYDRTVKDEFGIESEIATKIASTLRAKLSGAEHRALAARPTENVAAHDLYQKARFFAAKRTGPDIDLAISYYRQALKKDPKYALAYAGMAIAYELRSVLGKETAAGATQKARSAADKALALDPNLAEAHTALGLVLLFGDWKSKEAQRQLERAIALNPNSADAHYFSGYLILGPTGKFDRAISEIKHAIALDPFSLIMNANLGLTYTNARRYPEAVAQARRATELDPNFRYGHAILGSALFYNGDTPGAIAQLENLRRAAEADGGGNEYRSMVMLAYIYGLTGRRDKTIAMLKDVRRVEAKSGTDWAYGYALIQVALGDKQGAIALLERAYESKDYSGLSDIKVNPLLDPLRGEPRFEKLVAKIIPADAE